MGVFPNISHEKRFLNAMENHGVFKYIVIPHNIIPTLCIGASNSPKSRMVHDVYISALKQ